MCLFFLLAGQRLMAACHQWKNTYNTMKNYAITKTPAMFDFSRRARSICSPPISYLYMKLSTLKSSYCRIQAQGILLPSSEPFVFLNWCSCFAYHMVTAQPNNWHVRIGPIIVSGRFCSTNTIKKIVFKCSVKHTERFLLTCEFSSRLSRLFVENLNCR